MKKFINFAVLGMAAGLAVTVQAAAVPVSHAHIGHVMTQWGDTPEQVGFMTTAIGEAKIALQHASAAAKKPADLPWMQMHVAHVLHAIDPETMSAGPGMGYGVVKAATGVAKHIKAAAASADASGAVKAHAVHIAASAENVVGWSKQILRLGDAVMSADDAATAADLVQQIVVLAQQLQDGVDANGDGAVTWHVGEGGLNESQKHANILSKSEGLSQ